MSAWTGMEPDAVVAELGSDAQQGLAADQVCSRQEMYGANELVEKGGKSALSILWEQLTSLMVLLLIGAALTSGVALGEWEDAGVILVVVVLNAALGLRQEYKAEQSMAALKRLAVPTVKVRRDGELQEVSARTLVPGDLVLLEAGNLVPADCRLLETANLRVQESALTGEAQPVEKTSVLLGGEDLPLGDRRNMAYMGTVITYGRATAVVTAIGMQTELGRIATLIQEAEDEPTVLQKKLDGLGKVLVGVALLLIGVVALEGHFLLEMSPKAIFLTAVSMAVAAIPEGLPAVVTISLALGAQRMLRRRALIRRLPAVETLGSVTVICSDKTGTLTQNRMTVTEMALPDRQFDLPALPQRRRAVLREELARDDAVGILLIGSALCSDAEVRGGVDEGNFRVIGDPTEGALVAAAQWAGWTKADLAAALPRDDEVPFDSERKRMTTVHPLPATEAGVPEPLGALLQTCRDEGGAEVAFTKGAVDSLLTVSSRVWLDGAARKLTGEMRGRIGARNEEMAADGVRVLGLAVRAVGPPGPVEPALEQDLIFVGMVGMLDPLREEVKTAVQTCREAGIRPMMITGDHPLIARNIARDLGLPAAERCHTGRDLDHMDATVLDREVREVSLYARVAPEHKLNIVSALQGQGQVVAMTGDGVNDAPALKQADIGVAMGIAGTDVSKQASDMVLQDDNFATIVAAVEEGRVIFDNISRFVRFILASNLAEILVMLLASFFGLPLPLLPVQILWMNLVTDGLPALALGVEPGESVVMKRPPRDPQAPIFDRAMAIHICFVGVLMALLALLVGWAHYESPVAPAEVMAGAEEAAHGHGVVKPAPWQTMVFTTLVFAQLLLALAERSRRESLWRIGFFTNPHMVGAVALTFGLQFAVVYVPFLQRFFKTVGLSPGELGLCALLGLAVYAAVELAKMLRVRWERRS